MDWAVGKKFAIRIRAMCIHRILDSFCIKRKFSVRFNKTQSLNEISYWIWKKCFSNSSFMLLINFFFIQFPRSIDLTTWKNARCVDAIWYNVHCNVDHWPSAHQMFGWNSFLQKLLCQKWTLVETFNWLIAV